MTTNQTIDGVLVPRELAKRLAVPMLRTPEYLFDHRDALDELRALLDAADHVHEWDINSEGTATVCHCGARSSDEPAEQPAPVAFPGYPPVPDDRNLPAAHPQGEPVAYLDLEKIQPAGMAYATKMRANHRQSALYTGQPAPVAVVMPERKDPGEYRDASYTQTCMSGEWNACLDELKRLNPSL